MTGLRRCGKSTLLSQFQEWLKETGVSEEQIISINFEELEYEKLLDYKKLYAYIKKRLVVGKMTYIFLDKIQKVPDFEKVVDSLNVKPNIDIYITGSNAYMLSGDLATLLTGRYVEIKMLPLSFSEFLEATKLDRESGFAEYLQCGGLPYVATMNRTAEKVDTYLEGIYNTVIVKDIEDRQARLEHDKKLRKITDVALLKAIAKYLASAIGSPISIKSIADYLISSGRKVGNQTVDDYVDVLTEAFIFYSVPRFDIVGKSLLKFNGKCYIVDLGFSIENIVYLELLRRGYRVFVGKVGPTEVDFVAEKQGTYTYIQVTADMTAEETFNREIAPLRNIRDNYDKMILTLDKVTLGNYEGIKVINLLDWLLDNGHTEN